MKSNVALWFDLSANHSERPYYVRDNWTTPYMQLRLNSASRPDELSVISKGYSYNDEFYKVDGFHAPILQGMTRPRGAANSPRLKS